MELNNFIEMTQEQKLKENEATSGEKMKNFRKCQRVKCSLN